MGVVGYHAAPQLVAGGFVGVDVFFALSGFLITALILRQESQDRFCLKTFYLRRAMRIGPSLIVMLASILVIGWWFLLPHEFHELRGDMMHSLTDFMRLMVGPEADYFEGAVEEKPLVHLWSLAVEVQFYFLWPLMLVAMAGRRERLTALLLIVLVSFGTNLLMAGATLARAYYLPQTRVWQLTLGGLLAFSLHQGAAARYLERFLDQTGLTRAGAANIASGVGLALIAVSAFGLTDRLAYPGWWAIVPTLGALLVIAAGAHATLNRRLLSSPLMVGLGLVSYALYLWHWPLLAFRNVLNLDDDVWATVTCLATALALAAATYRYIELPLRSLRLPLRSVPRRGSLR